MEGAPWSTHRVGDTRLHWVDQPEALPLAVERIAALASGAIAIDLEGVSLSRHGELCVVQIATGRRDDVWAFDICALGAGAFAGAPSLRTLLEDAALTKFFWDCRSDCNALEFLYSVRPASVVDLQLMDVAHRLARGLRATSVTGLGVLVERTPHAQLTAAQRARTTRVKAEALRLFSPKEGGSYEVWRERPLRPVLREYVTDAALFFSIRDSLAAGAPRLLEAEAQAALAAATQRRLALSWSEAFDQVKGNKALAVGVDSFLVRDLRALGLVLAPAEGPEGEAAGGGGEGGEAGEEAAGGSGGGEDRAAE